MEVYAGETSCSICTRKAYYLQTNQIFCGYHSSKNHRTRLPKNPDAGKLKDLKISQLQTRIEEVATINRRVGRRGDVVVSKFRMMKIPDDIDGYLISFGDRSTLHRRVDLKVFPNFKHGGRKDGHPNPSFLPSLWDQSTILCLICHQLATWRIFTSFLRSSPLRLTSSAILPMNALFNE